MNRSANDGDRHHSSTGAHLSCRRTDDDDDRDARKRETLLIELILLLVLFKVIFLFQLYRSNHTFLFMCDRNTHDVIYSYFRPFRMRLWPTSNIYIKYEGDTNVAIGRTLLLVAFYFFFSRSKVCWKDIARGGPWGGGGIWMYCASRDLPYTMPTTMAAVNIALFLKIKTKQKKNVFRSIWEKNEP